MVRTTCTPNTATPRTFADWGKLIAGTAVGLGVAAIPLPGSTAAGVMIAPIAADFGGEVVNTFIGQEIDKATDGAEQDPTEKAQLTSQQFYGKGVDDLGKSYESYFSKYEEAGGKADSQQVVQNLKTTYEATGSAEDDFRGRPPYRD
ncbi:hypothetical protein [Streptomyces mirabilis]|uniref:hypothetical protein n=1 Tax=Streptomyces mirabilis TaxID=68239 RepID=UPI00339EAF17